MRRRLRSVWRAKETQLCGVKRSWEIIADNLSKAGSVAALCQPWIVRAEQSGLQTRIAAAPLQVQSLKKAK